MKKIQKCVKSNKYCDEKRSPSEFRSSEKWANYELNTMFKLYPKAISLARVDPQLVPNLGTDDEGSHENRSRFGANGSPWRLMAIFPFLCSRGLSGRWRLRVPGKVLTRYQYGWDRVLGRGRRPLSHQTRLSDPPPSHAIRKAGTMFHFGGRQGVLWYPL